MGIHDKIHNEMQQGSPHIGESNKSEYCHGTSSEL